MTWRDARSAGVVSNVVRHVLVPIVNRRICNELYEKIADKVKLEISEDMTCAGADEGGRDACQVNHSPFQLKVATRLNLLVLIKCWK